MLYYIGSSCQSSSSSSSRTQCPSSGSWDWTSANPRGCCSRPWTWASPISGSQSGLWISEVTRQVAISPIFYEQLFCTKVFCAAFMCLQFGSVIFWRQDFGVKAANKMLVTLTPGCPSWKPCLHSSLWNLSWFQFQHQQFQYLLHKNLRQPWLPARGQCYKTFSCLRRESNKLECLSLADLSSIV
jgi:hypothetical protein